MDINRGKYEKTFCILFGNFLIYAFVFNKHNLCIYVCMYLFPSVPFGPPLQRRMLESIKFDKYSCLAACTLHMLFSWTPSMLSL